VTIANELYGEIDGKSITQRNYGKGKIIWSDNAKQVLLQLNIEPDFSYTSENPDATIHYTHKLIGSDDFYFISNHRRRREKFVCSFRNQNKKPELWDAETGTISDAFVYAVESGRTLLSLTLEPSSSVFVVFRKRADNKNRREIYKDGKELLTLRRFPPAKPDMFADVTNDFTISIWAKPDTYAHPGRSMLFHAPQGKIIYGEGHAAVALGMGQNGIRVYERYTGNHQTVLEYARPIEGWSHVVLQYKSSVPHLFVNGKLVAEGKASQFIVHPGLGTAAAYEQFTTWFEGNYTSPQLFKSVLAETEINEIFKNGLPEFPLPSGIDILKSAGKTKALFWENGLFSFQSADKSKLIGDIKDCRAIEITGEWNVRFPKESGVPAEIVLPSLISLHKHEDFNVKHFSGTCTYNKSIPISKSDLLPGKKLFLHLGRVEVIAEVKINGTKIGLLWKEPFMIDITKAVKSGNNLLEVAVTNLWPNRLIGDEYLPIENEYSEHKFIKKLPEWFVNNQPKLGERKSFAVWKTHERSDPLLESGLLGPVKLLTAIEKIVE
jgi:hypothetical protein